MNPFTDLTNGQLQSLHAAFQHGALKYGVTAEGLRQQGISMALSTRIDLYLKERGLQAAAAVAIIEAVSQTRAGATNLALVQTLVVTGPAIPDDEILKTSSRFIEVVQHAKRELMLATFALYQGDQILAPIHEAMKRNPDLRVREKRPAAYFFPLSLELDHAKRASMHAKFVIADGERCFITSANFTEAAQKKNIEVGVELSETKEASRLADYIHGLIRDSSLHPLF